MKTFPRTLIIIIASTTILSVPAICGQESAAPAPQPSDTGVKPKVFVTDSQSWETRASAGGANGTWGAHASGGARPQTAEIIKTFEQKCPQVQINNRPDVVDYVVELDHEGGKGLLRHKDKVVVFDRRNGDSIGSKSTLSVGGSVEDACSFVMGHWDTHSKELISMRESENSPSESRHPELSATQAPTSIDVASISISSNPSGADIEIDGSYVGSTPSVVHRSPGTVVIKIQKKGFNSWERKLQVSGGEVKVNADLDVSAAGTS